MEKDEVLFYEEISEQISTGKRVMSYIKTTTTLLPLWRIGGSGYSVAKRPDER